MELQHAWKELLESWPADMPRRGVLVTNFNEQILFSGFLTAEAFVLVDRNAPDTMGARKLIVPYNQIAAIKIVDVVKSKSLAQMGFEGKLSER